MTVADYCPTCQERTGLTERGVCAWCDTPLVAKARRGGWKRPDLAGSKLTDAQLRALHHVYWHDQVSINQLAKQIHAKVGYRSHHSCAVAISNGWKRLGLQARDRIAAVRLASTTHGHGARDRDEQEYRRFIRDLRGWRTLQGPGQEQCAAVKQQPPGKGERCARPSMTGSDYCVSHDPARARDREARLERMRARAPRPDMEPMAPFAAWLRGLRDELGSMRAVAAVTGLNYTAACRYVQGMDTAGRPKDTVSVQLVRDARAAYAAFVEQRDRSAA